MNYSNKFQDILKITSHTVAAIIFCMAAIIPVKAQSISDSCLTIPYSSSSLIQINKSDAIESTIGDIGVTRVQAIALNATVDTIFAARVGQLGFLTFQSKKFKALPQKFGTGNGSLGPVEFIEVEGLTFDFTSNTLYGTVKVAEPNDDVLIKINQNTGAFIPNSFGPGIDYVTISGPGVLTIVEDIAINPLDGQMYGLSRQEEGNDNLITISKQDGAAQVVGPAGIDLLEGLGFDNKGNLYATPGLKTTLPARFFKMNLTNGIAMTIGELSTLDYESCDCMTIPQGENVGPTAKDDQYATIIDSTLVVEAPGVLGNDSDPNGDTLSIVSHDTTTVAGGNVSLNPDGGFTYTPPDGFSGIDSFTYTVTDGNNATDSATVKVLVMDPDNNRPNAMDDNYSTNIDSPLVVVAPGVLANDFDQDGDSLFIIEYDSTTLAGGMIDLLDDGGFSYAPPDGYQGEDGFNYIISDGRGGVDTAFVSIKVIDGATDPVANDDVYSTGINTELIVDAPGVLINDSDPNGDSLTVVSYNDSEIDGTLMMNPDGSFTYTPAMDSVNTEEFTYIVSDGDGNTDTAKVTISILVVITGNSPPIAQDDTVSTDQDLMIEVTDPEQGILINDSDPDGDSIAALEVNNGITDQGGSIAIFSNGTFSYSPRLGFTGVDTYEYTICDDGQPELCDKATIFIEVKELPVVVFDAYSPNGDGINDIWVIQGITRFPNNQVQIFNRWGNLVYQVKGYDNSANSWQGQSTEGVVFGSSQVPDGAYFYVINLGDGSKSLSGYVVVRR